MKRFNCILVFLSFSFLLISCRKELQSDIQIKLEAEAGIPAFPFDWETADYMPTPTGTSILVPWANGAVKGFSSDLWYDFLKSDGWVLVYNTFNTGTLPDNPWFALYNRYRGLLRIYVYVTTSGFTTSSYLTSGLNLNPNLVGSSTLNYIGQDIVDITQNQTAVSVMEPTQMSSNTWYACQYEIAYDPGIPSRTYQQLGLNWTLKWTSVSSVDLAGDQVGTLEGTISTPASNFNILGEVKNGAISLTGLAVLNGNKGTEKPGRPGFKNGLGLLRRYSTQSKLV